MSDIENTQNSNQDVAASQLEETSAHLKKCVD